MTKNIRYVKYIVILAAAVIGGILLGRFFSSYDTQYLLSREYCGDFRGIAIYKCGEINRENFVGHAYMLDSAPDVLVESCTKMYFTGGSLTVPVSGNVNALGITQDTTVYISTDTFNADVVYHELFHAFDNANGKLTETDEFLRIYYKEMDKVYVEVVDDSTRPEEFFAAAGAQYLLEPDILKAAAPETYDYIDRLIGYYE